MRIVLLSVTTHSLIPEIIVASGSSWDIVWVSKFVFFVCVVLEVSGKHLQKVYHKGE